jgi:phospholipid/cholesterol/gamma-HCH transport system substrate-binding protein
MLSRLARGQVLAFVVLTLVALSYASIVYVKLPERLGIGRHTLYVELTDSGDLYPRAAVAMRGVPIGEVERLELTPTGAHAVLSVDDDALIPPGLGSPGAQRVGDRRAVPELRTEEGS